MCVPVNVTVYMSMYAHYKISGQSMSEAPSDSDTQASEGVTWKITTDTWRKGFNSACAQLPFFSLAMILWGSWISTFSSPNFPWATRPPSDFIYLIASLPSYLVKWSFSTGPKTDAIQAFPSSTHTQDPLHHAIFGRIHPICQVLHGHTTSHPPPWSLVFTSSLGKLQSKKLIQWASSAELQNQGSYPHLSEVPEPQVAPVACSH